ncbi:MAG: transglutaminase domain-containing protein, partial [Dehalococcoidales bacterium]|nr:transglutaminase domain-containing protein [Dehalococcoidales bacterium]
GVIKSSHSKVSESNRTSQSSSSQPNRTETRSSGGQKKFNQFGKQSGKEFPKWMIALMFILAFSIIGIGLSLFISTFIPLWILLGFSIIFSIEKWFNYYTRKYKWIGRLYRLILNLSILALLGLLIGSGIKLFSQQFLNNTLIASLLFIAEFVFFIWLWRIVARNSWRWPSMKLTVFSLIGLSVVFAFAGVQPMTTYKDKVASFISSTFNNSSQLIVPSSTPATTAVTKSTTTKPSASLPTTTTTKPSVSTTTPTASASIVAGTTSSIDRSAFSIIDQYALATPETVSKSINTLAAYLVQPAKNDFEKARAIYRWITQNISYDFSAYLTKNYGSTSAADVLISQSSVCQGYATLFNALAKSAGLEVVTISGWAKGYSYNAGDSIIGATNHAWNAVKIEDGWYLIDSTWGAGYISQQEFVRDFDESYFLTPPDLFILNHLPENTKWQLLSSPLSKNEFSTLPYVYSNFFSYGLDLGNNTQAILNTKSSLSLFFSVPNNIYLMARIFKDNVKLSDTYTSANRSGSNYQINATFPSSGTYTLTIYAREGDEFGMYDGILEYKVIAGNTP